MPTLVSNLTNKNVSSGALNLGPNAFANVDVLTSDVLALYAAGTLALTPAPSTRTPLAIANNSGGTEVGAASIVGVISATTLTVSQKISVMAAIVVNVAFPANLSNVPVTFTGGTLTTGGAHATGLFSTGAGGTTATLAIDFAGNYSVAPTGITGTGLGSGTFTTFTPTLVADKTGTIAIGQSLSGVGVTAGTYITAGSALSWTVSASQTVAVPTAIAAAPGLAAIVAGGTYAQADIVALRNAVVSLSTQLNAAKAAIDYLTTAVAKLSTDKDINPLS